MQHRVTALALASLLAAASADVVVSQQGEVLIGQIRVKGDAIQIDYDMTLRGVAAVGSKNLTFADIRWMERGVNGLSDAYWSKHLNAPLAEPFQAEQRARLAIPVDDGDDDRVIAMLHELHQQIQDLKKQVKELQREVDGLRGGDQAPRERREQAPRQGQFEERREPAPRQGQGERREQGPRRGQFEERRESAPRQGQGQGEWHDRFMELHDRLLDDPRFRDMPLPEWHEKLEQWHQEFERGGRRGEERGQPRQERRFEERREQAPRQGRGERRQGQFEDQENDWHDRFMDLHERMLEDPRFRDMPLPEWHEQLEQFHQEFERGDRRGEERRYEERGQPREERRYEERSQPREERREQGPRQGQGERRFEDQAPWEGEPGPRPRNQDRQDMLQRLMERLPQDFNPEDLDQLRREGMRLLERLEGLEGLEDLRDPETLEKLFENPREFFRERMGGQRNVEPRAPDSAPEFRGPRDPQEPQDQPRRLERPRDGQRGRF